MKTLDKFCPLRLSSIPEVDWAYLAGMFDGEGCIKISNRIRKTSPRPRFEMTLDITNTHGGVIIALHKKFGGSAYSRDPVEGDVVRRRKFCWQIMNRPAITFFLEKMLPYLIVKRTQATIAHRFVRRVGSFKGKKLTEKEVRIRANMVLAIKNSRNRKWAHVPKDTPKTLNCPNCNKVFLQKVVVQKFCSHRCTAAQHIRVKRRACLTPEELIAVESGHLTNRHKASIAKSLRKAYAEGRR